jgi:hypothetical protein
MADFSASQYPYLGDADWIGFVWIGRPQAESLNRGSDTRFSRPCRQFGWRAADVSSGLLEAQMTSV